MTDAIERAQVQDTERKPSFDPLATTFSVDFENETFVFHAPSVLDEMKVSGVARDWRARTTGDATGSIAGLDVQAVDLSFALAEFELFLESGPPWVFNAKGKVDPEGWAPEKLDTVLTVHMEYGQKLVTFRSKRNKHRKQARP